MRPAAKIAALALLVAWCAGCGRKAPQVQLAPEAEAPSLPPAQMALLIPPVPPPLPSLAERAVKLDTTPPPENEASAAHTRPRRIFRRKPRSADPAQEPSKSAAPTAPETQIASGQLPSEQSPIGQLSTANDSANTADRRTLIDLINSIENGLNAIHRPLSSDERKTATQVRTFITRARDALKIDDLDGAHTLATKAHLLLQELTKQ